MKTKWFFLAALLFTTARAAVPEQVWRYQLLEGSFLMDECLICGRPTFNIPMRGSFMLRLVETTPISTRYAIENAEFQASADYTFKGSGTYEIAGQLAVKQTMTLQGDLQTTSGT